MDHKVNLETSLNYESVPLLRTEVVEHGLKIMHIKSRVVNELHAHQDRWKRQQQLARNFLRIG